MPLRQVNRGEVVELSRIYDNATQGYRVLVDRLWPRGVSKDAAALDEWLKDAAPTAKLREWYGHRPDRFVEFKRRYTDELSRPPARQAVEQILATARIKKVLLLTATRNVEHSAAQVLLEHLHSAVRDHIAPTVDDVVDGWGQDSFPASDPPGGLPPTLAGS